MSIETTKKLTARGAPGWMVTFADLMALLMALFVLILSFAEFDVDKFMKNTGPIPEAFNSTRDNIPFTRMQVGNQALQTASTPRYDLGDHDLQWIQNTLDQLERTLSEEISGGNVVVEDVVDGVVVRIGDDTTFASGSNRLSARAKDILDNVANVITGIESRVVVSGHTNDESLKGSSFTSNWELSASRAATVVDFLVSAGKVESNRVMAQGFANSRPLSEALTLATKAANRRV